MKIATEQNYFDLLDWYIDQEMTYVIWKIENILWLKKNSIYNKCRRKQIDMGLFIWKSTITWKALFPLLYKEEGSICFYILYYCFLYHNQNMSIMKNEDYYSIEQNHNWYDVMRDQQAEEYEYLKDQWLEENYNDIRYAYEMYLIVNWYVPYV